MASRFDIAMGKIKEPKKRPSKKKSLRDMVTQMEEEPKEYVRDETEVEAKDEIEVEEDTRSSRSYPQHRNTAGAPIRRHGGLVQTNNPRQGVTASKIGRTHV